METGEKSPPFPAATSPTKSHRTTVRWQSTRSWGGSWAHEESSGGGWDYIGSPERPSNDEAVGGEADDGDSSDNGSSAVKK
jgi:hypothetical protein